MSSLERNLDEQRIRGEKLLTVREAVYLPDALRIVADLAERAEAYGRDRGIPGSGQLTAERLAEIASKHLGRAVGVRAASQWPLKVLALLHPGLRAIRPMIPHYVRPVRYDTASASSIFG